MTATQYCAKLTFRTLQQRRESLNHELPELTVKVQSLMPIAFRAAQSIIELSRTQDEEVGDGTTSVIILGAMQHDGPSESRMHATGCPGKWQPHALPC